ncbi:uncharacterized protein B0T23DRAFT_327838 [Neurospora hispaniola]|uniref:Uncharacterized protein n=1 Tax=Neurospora hispaniola TaxID=588809 RepID=A0AAJ0HY04_9PEZI|nr:hypothetical protein B0T23DRAFT_327838 [Neurospora hispaniola]
MTVMTAIYGVSFVLLCVVMWFFPEPKLSAVCGILILIGWDVTFHLREIIAVQKEQLQEHQTAKLTTDKIDEYTTLYGTLVEKVLVLNRDLLFQNQEILAHSKEKLAHDKDKLSQEKETLPQFKEIVAMQKEILGSRKERADQKGNAGLAHEKETLNQYKETGSVHRELLDQCREILGCQRRLVLTTDRSAVLQLRMGDMVMVQLRQLDVLLRKLGVEVRPPLPPGAGLRPSRPGDHAQ